MASALLSGAFRISNGGGNVFNRVLSTTTTVSTWFIQDMILANGVSDLVVSIASLSNAKVVVVIGGESALRINYTGHASYASAASAGWEFKDLWAHIGQTSGIQGLHFANSSGNSVTTTVIMGQ